MTPSQCCPPHHGCNAPGHGEACALELCRRAADHLEEAALALARWQEWRQARDSHAHRHELRFRRRAYDRARDSAITAMLLAAA
jgi:hypothetical protein